MVERSAAPAGVVRSHALGRPRVTVRPHYGGLPARAGRDRTSGRKLVLGPAKSRPSESRKHGPEAQNRRSGAPSGARPAIRTLAPQGVDFEGRCSALRSLTL